MGVAGLVPESTLRGRVTDASNHTLASAVVGATPIRDAPQVIHATRATTAADRDGGYRLTGLPPGRWEITCAWLSHQRPPVKITTELCEGEDVVFDPAFRR